MKSGWLETALPSSQAELRGLAPASAAAQHMLLPRPRVLCSVFLFSTVWAAPLLWASFYGEYSAADFFVPGQCTVVETNIKRVQAGRLVRYVAAWDVYWYRSPPVRFHTHGKCTARS